MSERNIARLIFLVMMAISLYVVFKEKPAKKPVKKSINVYYDTLKIRRA